MKYNIDYKQDPDSGWWVATAPSVPGVITQGRTIDEARERVREAIAAMLDEDVSEDEVGP